MHASTGFEVLKTKSPTPRFSYILWNIVSDSEFTDDVQCDEFEATLARCENRFSVRQNPVCPACPSCICKVNCPTLYPVPGPVYADHQVEPASSNCIQPSFTSPFFLRGMSYIAIYINEF